VLISGKSYAALNANQSETPEPWTSGTPFVDDCGPEVFEVEPARTYRFRVIGGLALTYVAFMFEDHEDLTVIAADGRYTQAARTDRIQIGPGQRFDFLLKTISEEGLAKASKDCFWIQFETRWRPINITSYAVLRYEAKSNATSSSLLDPPRSRPLNIMNDTDTWLEGTLQPLHNNGFPSLDEVTRTVYLPSTRLNNPHGNEYSSYWTVNNRTSPEDNEQLGGAL
jgi:hypothetical protein